jgi:predicted AlkP superfamily phosphohydrolase/phosphomutase
VQSEVDAHQRRSRWFFRAWNNDVVGGVRLNLQGRESAGLIPADEADAVLVWLERKLSRLVNVSSGRAAVRRFYRNDALLQTDAVAGEVDPCLPDLYIEWDRSQQIEHVWSPSTGSIRHPSTIWRTGDHWRRGAMLVAGPGVTPGQHPRVDATRVVPSLARLLGIPLSQPIDRSVDWITP